MQSQIKVVVNFILPVKREIKKRKFEVEYIHGTPTLFKVYLPSKPY